MKASFARGVITAAITIVIMSVVTVFISGGKNSWFWHHPRHAGDDVHVHLHADQPVQLHRHGAPAVQPGLRRRQRNDGRAASTSRGWCRDVPGAKPLEAGEGRIDFEGINFWYQDGGEGKQVFEDFEQPAHPRRSEGGAGGQERRRKDHPHEASAAPCRHPGGQHQGGRPGRRHHHAAEPAPPDRRTPPR